jgi:hypothetical protein
MVEYPAGPEAVGHRLEDDDKQADSAIPMYQLRLLMCFPFVPET